MGFGIARVVKLSLAESLRSASICVRPKGLRLAQGVDSRSPRHEGMGQHETDLIQRAQRGERGAFEELIRAHEEMVYAMLFRQLGDREAALDVTQEVFIKAYLKLPQYEGRARFSTWLIRIALNSGINFVRSRAWAQRAQHDSADIEALFSASEEELEEKVEQEARRDQFRRMLDRLPELYRSAIVICGLESKSYEEAAEILGIPVGTVRSRLNKARLLLREMIHE